MGFPTQDLQNDMTETSDIKRNPLWAFAGLMSLAFGIIGIFLPLLPTTPLVLLAAFCFAKGSPRLHAWLVNHPRFGPSITDWQTRGAISSKGKRMALMAMAAVLLVSILLGLAWYLIAIQVTCLGAVSIFIMTRPS